MGARPKKEDFSVEEKLRALYDLQYIDSKIDRLRNVYGELPLEVEDLEDEIAGLEKRMARFEAEIHELEEQITDRKHFVQEAEALKKRYVLQRDKARNDREYDALTKEIEYQDLEVEAAEKKGYHYKIQIERKQELVQQTEANCSQRRDHLKHKRGELDDILKEIKKEEDFLIKKSKEFSRKIETRLLDAYRRIRRNVKNGLAVVPVERGASGGSFFVIPPQQIMEIAQRKRVITDEHSGRILIDPALAAEEAEKIESMINAKH